MNVPVRSAVLLVCCGVSVVLGSIHGFSVFVPGLESGTGEGRGAVTLVYSVALTSLTLAVLLGPYLYDRFLPSVIFAMVAMMAAGGLWSSAGAETITAWYLYYGLVFGFANGLGYGFLLQLSARVCVRNPGSGMTTVTAFYAVGATLAPSVYLHWIDLSGNVFALRMSALIIAVVTLLAAITVHLARIRFERKSETATVAVLSQNLGEKLLIWMGYGSGVAAGLMTIGHAYPLGIWLSLDQQYLSLAPTAVALGNMLGGFAMVYAVRQVSSERLVQALPLITVLGLCLLLLAGSVGSTALLALALIGFGYGALIAVYPVLVMQRFGQMQSSVVYGQVFTAWGVAGLTAPWLSGKLFDASDSYSSSLITAITLAVISVVVITRSRTHRVQR